MSNSPIDARPPHAPLIAAMEDRENALEAILQEYTVENSTDEHTKHERNRVWAELLALRAATRLVWLARWIDSPVVDLDHYFVLALHWMSSAADRFAATADEGTGRRLRNLQLDLQKAIAKLDDARHADQDEG